MNSLKNKIAVITGAGSGIGRELAVQLTGMGAIVAITDIHEEWLYETANMVMRQGGSFSAHLVDVSKRHEVYRFAEEVISQHGETHIVINNAGVALSNVSVEDLSYEDFEWILGINMWGVIYGTKAFLPYLKKQPEANLVNVSSLYGLTAVAKAAAYCTSKFAVRGFTEALRQELRHTSVRVTIVHPGGIRTNIARNTRHATHGDPMVDPERVIQHFEQRARTTASEAARMIIDGIRRNAPRVLIGTDARFLDILVRLRPDTYDTFILKHIVNEDEKVYRY